MLPFADLTRYLARSVGDVPSRVSPVADVWVVRTAGYRAGRADRATHGGGHAGGRRGGCGGVVSRVLPVLLASPLGRGSDRAGAGPADRGSAALRGCADRCGGRRHAVPPLGAEGVRRVVDPRRVRAGSQRARPGQPVGDRRDPRAAAVLRASGVLAGAAATLARQGHRVPGPVGA